jgi:hypothetical protein
MMPNGLTYYYFCDNSEFAWSDAIIQAARLPGMC